MASTNTSPTMDDLKAIETEWNAAVTTEYQAAIARYADIDITLIDMGAGSQLLTTLHPVTNQPLFQVRNKDTLQPYVIPRDMLNARHKYSLVLDVTDLYIKHSCALTFDSNGVVMLIAFHEHHINDVIGTRLAADGETEESYTEPGLTTLLAANKVNIYTNDAGVKSIVILP